VNIDTLIKIIAVLIAMIILFAMALRCINAMMGDDAEPIQPTDADRHNNLKGGQQW
jgi:hypothetical protein